MHPEITPLPRPVDTVADVVSKLTRLARLFPAGSEFRHEITHAAERLLNIPHQSYAQGFRDGERKAWAQVRRQEGGQ